MRLTAAQRQALKAVALDTPYLGCHRAAHFRMRGRILNKLIDWRLVGSNKTHDGITLTDAGRAKLEPRSRRSR